MPREQEFLYASGRIRLLETKLLNKNLVERLMEADTIEGVIKALGDTAYAEDFTDLDNIYEFEEVLENNLLKTFRVIGNSIKDSKIIRYFTLKYDYHNLKVCVKGKIMGDIKKEYFSKLGEVPLEYFLKLASEEKSTDLPKDMIDSFEKAVALYEETHDPQQIDVYIDRLLFEELAKLVKEIKEPFLEKYHNAYVDLLNIKTFVRIKNMNMDLRALQRAILPGGSIPEDFYEKKFQESMEDFVESFSSKDYYKVVKEGIENWSLTKNPSLYEKLMDNYLINYLKKGLYKPFGVEPVIGYLGAKEHEIKILRLILVGKINGISEDLIGERLRELYV